MRLVLCLSPNPRFPLHTSRAKLCGNWAEYSSVASLCSVNLSPPLPVRSFVRSLLRSVPLSHPISNCAHSESECDFALDFTTGRERMKLQGLPLIPNEWHRFMSWSKTRARRTHHRCRKLSPGPSFSKCDIKVGKINYLYRVIDLVMEHCLLTSN